MGAFRSLLGVLLLATGIVAAAGERVLRVAALTNSPPMSYVDASGNLTGFQIGIARALCEVMEVRCEMAIVSLERIVDAVAAGEYDFAAVGLLDTPERRAKILFTKAYYHSNSAWVARPGVEPGAPGLRVATVAGSAQFRYARSQGWKVVAVSQHSEFSNVLAKKEADAVLAPMTTALTLRQDRSLQHLGLATSFIKQPELSGDVYMIVDPRNPALREALDRAIDRVKRDGRFDRLNTEYLPFRLQ